MRASAIHAKHSFAIHSIPPTYDFLSLSTSRFLRRYPRRYGYGWRYGYHPLARARRRCRTKNCTMRQPIFLFPHEPCRTKNPRRQRFGRNARALVGVLPALALSALGAWSASVLPSALLQKGFGLFLIFLAFLTAYRALNSQKN